MLHHAAYGGKEGVVQLLLKRGANIKAGNKEGQTALGVATGRSHWGGLVA